MLTKRPDRAPDLTIRDLHSVEGIDDQIFYQFADSKGDRVESWEIPHNSNFDVTICPVELDTGESYAVWSTQIDVPYVTTKGKQRTKKRFDWEWVEPLEKFRNSTSTELTKRIRHKQVKEAFEEVKKAMNKFNDLFEKE